MCCPIIRQANGLALSSRNAYLVESDQEIASTIHKMLLEAKTMLQNSQTQSSSELISHIQEHVHESITVDYIDIVFTCSLKL